MQEVLVLVLCIRRERGFADRLDMREAALCGHLESLEMKRQLGAFAGTLYPLLHRMEAAGLLVSRTEIVDGRRRRLYAITDRGREVLADCRAALGELSGELLPS